MCNDEPPGMFGIIHTNRDFNDPDVWGKNQFNSSFPTALACYMHSRNIAAVYYTLNQNGRLEIKKLPIRDLFNADPLSDDTYYAFETSFQPYQRFIDGTLPRTDLVIQNRRLHLDLAPLEIKLTALPDQQTFDLDEDKYGSEIVVRPDTIVYQACSLAKHYVNNRQHLHALLGNLDATIRNWESSREVIPHISQMVRGLRAIVREKWNEQKPLIMQPVWKTKGKSPTLSDDCLDIFVWSDFGLFSLFMPDGTVTKINRHTRTVIWLYKMLLDFSIRGRFNPRIIIDSLSYDTKNDKAFATSGLLTHAIMHCDELTHPRIHKDAIKEIILGNGQTLLSPERRFDAIIYNSPGLFEDD